jgi:hypothetical protein
MASRLRSCVTRQALGETGGDGIELRDDDVAGHRRVNFARRPQPHPSFEPPRVKQPDEQEGQHHQEKHHSREQHDDAEDAADIAFERDVAEAERRHHDERPVEAGDPGMRLVLDAQLDDVKENGVDGDEGDEEGEVLEERAPRLARASRSDVK